MTTWPSKECDLGPEVTTRETSMRDVGVNRRRAKMVFHTRLDEHGEIEYQAWHWSDQEVMHG